ncbi:MAG: MFS transporter [Eubacterium sp.]|nr:MFS transporter [Eubacterium sp.]
MENSKLNPFGFKDKIGYMFGDFGNDFTFIFASTYLMIFYTKVLGIDAAMVGVLFLVARCVDAFTDIGMGRIVDSSPQNTKGKFRIWILRMCIPVAVSSFFMYQSAIAGMSMTFKIIYMFVTYLLWGSIFYTSINIPYGSMASVISEKPKDRQSLSVYRSLGSTFAAVAISVVTPLFIYETDAEGNQVVIGGRFTLAAAAFSVLAVVCYLFCYFLVTERVKLEKNVAEKKHMSIWKTLGQVFSSRALLAMILISILTLCASIMGQSISTFLFADYFKNTKALSFNNLLGLPAAIILAAISGKLVERFGRKELSSAGCVVAAVLFFAMYFLKLTNVWVFIIVNFIASVGGMYLFNMTVWAMITDVIDDKEVHTMQRDDGTIYGVYSFARKLGQALAGGLGGFALSAIGYDSLALAQTDSVRSGIYALSTLFPAVIYTAVTVVFIVVYPLSKRRVEENAKELQTRRGGQ